MSLQKSIFFTIFIFSFTLIAFAQTDSRAKTAQTPSKPIAQSLKLSPAFAELLLRKTEREAQLEELLLDYTEDFPKVKELKFETELLQKQMEKMSAISAADASKLSLALGRLLVRKTELEVELWNLLRQYNGDHPEVKRAKRKIEIYDKAVKEILP